jgi:hypothetical protein
MLQGSCIFFSFLHCIDDDVSPSQIFVTEETLLTPRTWLGALIFGPLLDVVPWLTIAQAVEKSQRMISFAALHVCFELQVKPCKIVVRG